MVLLGIFIIIFVLLLVFWPTMGYGRANIRQPNTTLPDDTSVDFEELLNTQCPKTGDHYLVVGAGFLGSKLIHALLLRGEERVRAFDIDPTALAPELRDHPHVEFVQGDVTRLEDIQGACNGVDTVFCTFAIIRFFERLPAYACLSERINVHGTANVVRACLDEGIKRLIQTSTSNVCLARELVHLEMTEESPYVTTSNSPNHYGWTKALAEQRILAANGQTWANGKGHITTASIRPCSGIFGRRDKLNLERIFELDRALMLMPRTYLDWVFVDNVAWGHLLLEQAMQAGQSQINGEVFCVSNDEPMTFESFYNSVKTFYPALQINYMPHVLPRIIAHSVEALQRFIPNRLTPRTIGGLAILTPALFNTCLDYVFTTTKAKDILGYKPIYTVDQGIQKAIREHASDTLLPPLHRDGVYADQRSAAPRTPLESP